MKNSGKISAAVALRRRAEELLNKKPSNTTLQLSEGELMKLIHDLEVHQIELELINEEFKLAKQQAEITAKKYNELYDRAPTGYFTLSKSGKIIELNLYSSQMLGKESSRLINSPLGMFLSDDTKPVLKLFLEKLFYCKNLETCEVTIMKQGQTEVHAHLTGIINADEEQCQVNIVDITERKKTEKQLLFISKAVESASDAIGISDARGHHFYQNRALTDLFGYATAEEMEAAGGGAAVVKDPELAKEMYGNIMFGKSWSGELEMVSKTGRVFPAYERAASIKDSNGNVVGLIGIITDISERKHVERILQDSEERYKKSQEAGHVGSWEYDIKSGTFWGSDEGKRIYGFNVETDIFSAEEVMNCVIERDRVNQAMIDIIEKNSPYNIIFNILPLHSDEKKTIQSIAEITRDKHGNPIKVTGVVVDITVRQKAETEIKLKNEQLKQASAEKDKFFSIIAHDLRSPFQPLLGFTRMLVEDLPTLRLDEIQKMALSMRTAADKLFNLLENLLQWSRMQRGMIIFEPESFLLLPKISEFLDSISVINTSKEIDISYDISEEMTVFADHSMFESVIRNLTSNAIKFTHKGGKVSITAKSSDHGWIQIAVKDTGIGMNVEILENLFKPDKDTRRTGINNEPSTGLGLIICKDFIEKHGGRIWVESEEEKGSTFCFTLPDTIHIT